MKNYHHLLPLALVAACSTSPREPIVSLSVSVSAPRITVGQMPYDTIVVAVQNLTADSVTLHFGTSCPLDVWIRNAAGQRVAPPTSSCLQLLVPMSLGPHESTTPSLVWAGNTDWAGSASSPLPPGTYSVNASLVAAETTVQAVPASIELTAGP